MTGGCGPCHNAEDVMIFKVDPGMEYCGRVYHPLVGLLLSFIFVCVKYGVCFCVTAMKQTSYVFERNLCLSLLFVSASNVMNH